MLPLFDPLRQFTFWGVLCRLILALACAGLVGYGRTKRGCAAGLRTYMLIGLGGALSILITQYEYRMLHTVWAPFLTEVGDKFDASRLAAQAITGIGFLGAGTILKVSHQQVNGLTTATGMFATVSMGIAAGAGFYECVLIVIVMIVLVLNLMAPLEWIYKRHLRSFTLNIDMDHINNIEEISALIRSRNAEINEVDIETGPSPASAIFILKLDKDYTSHSAMLTAIAEMDCIRSVQELIS